jgi:AcrR family transcriptional regulator
MSPSRLERWPHPVISYLTCEYLWYIDTYGMATGKSPPATPPRLSRAESKAKTRARVLEAAKAVFEREGYHGASLERIAAAAGFTKGAVYSTFESKADVMLALLEGRAEWMQADLTETLAAAPTAAECVAAMARHSAARVAAERDWLAASNEFVIVVGRDEKLRPRYAALHEAAVSAVADSLSTWTRRSGERLAVSPRRAATAVIALHKGLVLEGMISPATLSEELFVETQLALLRGVFADGGREAGE